MIRFLQTSNIGRNLTTRVFAVFVVFYLIETVLVVFVELTIVRYYESILNYFLNKTIANDKTSKFFEVNRLVVIFPLEYLNQGIYLLMT